MAKKRRQKKKQSRTGWLISPQQVQAWLSQAESQIMAQDYAGALKTARRVLRYVHRGSEPYADAYHYMGLAFLMLQDFAAAYDALSTVLGLRPESTDTWYNRGLCCRYVARTGQSVRDLEQAIALEKNPILVEKYEKELAFSRGLVQHALDLRGPGFSLDQLIEQQETYQRALKAMEAKQWAEGGALFRQVIDMGDCLPQPWGNLAVAYIMRQRYDEAEAALRRALEIDPHYELARRNLEALPGIRQAGPPDLEIHSPFEGRDIKRSLTFIRDDE